jgi:hypothetical protein
MKMRKKSNKLRKMMTTVHKKKRMTSQNTKSERRK